MKNALAETKMKTSAEKLIAAWIKLKSGQVPCEVGQEEVFRLKHRGEVNGQKIQQRDTGGTEKFEHLHLDSQKERREIMEQQQLPGEKGHEFFKIDGRYYHRLKNII